MSFNAKDMTQGGQIASMRIRMFCSGTLNLAT